MRLAGWRRAHETTRRQGLVESFLLEFSLSTPEGLALMGLVEGLLRTPDSDSRDPRRRLQHLQCPASSDPPIHLRLFRAEADRTWAAAATAA